MKTPFGVKVSPILEELEKAILDQYEFEALPFFMASPREYTFEGTRAASLIFLDTLIDAIYFKAQKDGKPIEDSLQMISDASNEIKAIFDKYTGLDSFELFENPEKCKKLFSECRGKKPNAVPFDQNNLPEGAIIAFVVLDGAVIKSEYLEDIKKAQYGENNYELACESSEYFALQKITHYIKVNKI